MESLTPPPAAPLTPPSAPEPVAPAAEVTRTHGPGGVRRSILTAGLALGLLVVGGSAVVLAASPDPLASAAPSATTEPSTDDSSGSSAAPDDGTTTTKPDCPEGQGPGDGGDDGSDSSGEQPVDRTVPRDPVGHAGDLTRLGPGATSIGAMPGPTLPDALAVIDAWGADHATAALVGPDGTIAAHGDGTRVYWWASITKLLTATAILTAVDEGLIDLDEPAPAPAPTGATVRHLLAHASGLAFDGEMIQGRPGTRRIYSNTGFDILGTLLAGRDGVDVEDALRTRVLDPLRMAATSLVERPSQGLHGPLDDLARFARELLRPTLLSQPTFVAATQVALPGLDGVLPGVGRFDPLDWGLGFELRDGKDPHWMGTRTSPAAFGHFGGSGTFLWVDPALDRALVCLTDRPYGPWALEAWPPFSDGVIDALERR